MSIWYLSNMMTLLLFPLLPSSHHGKTVAQLIECLSHEQKVVGVNHRGGVHGVVYLNKTFYLSQCQVLVQTRKIFRHD